LPYLKTPRKRKSAFPGNTDRLPVPGKQAVPAAAGAGRAEILDKNRFRDHKRVKYKVIGAEGSEDMSSAPA
ncbi:MAG: hypothetical protein IIY46_05820, partial [Lachnospiraceae bacterium]|nr:hypothetical protein [Lachnospiraceae bacterium]